MLLTSPDPRQKVVTVAGVTFRRHRDGYFEIPNDADLVGPLLEDGFTEHVPKATEGSIVVPDNVKMAEFHAVVIRCGCGNPASHPGQICPNPAKAEDLGQIAGYYKNPLRRFAWWARKTFKRTATT